MPTTNKFINYGEIDKEDEEDEDDAKLDIPSTVTSVDIDEVKAKTEDINTNDNGNAALDNLLNLGNPTSAVPTEEFITPAEKIVKTATEEDEEDEESSDYFKLPDTMVSTSVASNTGTPSNVDLFINEPNQSKEKYTLEEATTKIKDLVEDLKNHGINIKLDEMNFEKSYQAIVKIDKTEE